MPTLKEEKEAAKKKQYDELVENNSEVFDPFFAKAKETFAKKPLSFPESPVAIVELSKELDQLIIKSISTDPDPDAKRAVYDALSKKYPPIALDDRTQAHMYRACVEMQNLSEEDHLPFGIQVAMERNGKLMRSFLAMVTDTYKESDALNSQYSAGKIQRNAYEPKMHALNEELPPKHNFKNTPKNFSDAQDMLVDATTRKEQDFEKRFKAAKTNEPDSPGIVEISKQLEMGGNVDVLLAELDPIERKQDLVRRLSELSKRGESPLLIQEVSKALSSEFPNINELHKRLDETEYDMSQDEGQTNSSFHNEDRKSELGSEIEKRKLDADAQKEFVTVIANAFSQNYKENSTLTALSIIQNNLSNIIRDFNEKNNLSPQSIILLKNQLASALANQQEIEISGKQIIEILNSSEVKKALAEKLAENFANRENLTVAERQTATMEALHTYHSGGQHVSGDHRNTVIAENAVYSQAIKANEGNPVLEVARLSDEPNPTIKTTKPAEKQSYIVTQHQLDTNGNVTKKFDVLDIPIPYSEKKHVKEAMRKLIEKIVLENKTEMFDVKGAEKSDVKKLVGADILKADLTQAYLQSKSDLGFTKNEAQAEKLLSAKYNEILATKKYRTAANENPKSENLITLQLEALKAKLEYRAALYGVRKENGQERTVGSFTLPSIFHGSSEKTATQKSNATAEMLLQVNEALGLNPYHRGKIQEGEKDQEQKPLNTANLKDPASNQFSNSGAPKDELSKLKAELIGIQNAQITKLQLGK